MNFCSRGGGGVLGVYFRKRGCIFIPSSIMRKGGGEGGGFSLHHKKILFKPIYIPVSYLITRNSLVNNMSLILYEPTILYMSCCAILWAIYYLYRVTFLIERSCMSAYIN